MQMYSDPHFQSLSGLLLRVLSVLITSQRVKCTLKKSHLGVEFMCKIGISLILECITMITDNTFVRIVLTLVQHEVKHLEINP